MSKTNFERNRLLDLKVGDGVYAKPPTYYFGLFTSAPTVAGGGTEVTGGAYTRVAVANDLANWPDAGSGTKANAIALAWAQASAPWGTVTHVGIFDALTGGNMTDFTALATPRAIVSGDTFSLPAGSIQFQEE
ncbi:MAG: hypothetical protein M3458_05335 [Acidobacteriota bacterium]|nr:hypothetical protein [Acidobacteriota bacterium]